MKQLDISVVICTYNGAARLPATLGHLARQVTPPALAWEVILVDNASTDDTAQVAARVWAEAGAPAPLRVVSEPRPGVSHARATGLDGARGDLIVCLDDDNWVAPDYFAQVLAVMAENPQAGACGGPAQAVYETEPPEWFPAFARRYALGPQGTGRTGPQKHLWGAGLTVRRDAWRFLREKGFAFSPDCQCRNQRKSGWDSELTWALLLAGGQLWYDPRLSIRHFVPTAKLTESYLLSLAHWRGCASVRLARYAALARQDLQPAHWWQATVALLRPLARHTFRVWQKRHDAPALRLAEQWEQGYVRGRWEALLRTRTAYNAGFAVVREAAWRQFRPTHGKTGTVLLVSRTPIHAGGHGDQRRDYQIWHDLTQSGADVLTLPFFDWHLAAQQQPRPPLNWRDRWRARFAARLPGLKPPDYPPRPFVPEAFYAEYEGRLKNLPRPLAVVLTDARLGRAAELNQKHGVATIWCPHNLEALDAHRCGPDKAELQKACSAWADEMWNLGQGAARLFISRVEMALANGLGMPSHYYPYLPVGLLRKRLHQIRQRRAPRAGLFVLMGCANHATTRRAMQWFAEQARKHGLPNGVRVVAVGEKSETLTTADGLELRGWLEQNELDELLAQCQAVLAVQTDGFGALTRLAEMACAGVPVLVSRHPVAALDAPPGLHVINDEWPAWCAALADMRQANACVPQAEYETWAAAQPQPLGDTLRLV